MTKVRIKTPLVDMLGIDHPIIQAAMGPLDTTNLAAAVSNAGGLGTISIPHCTDPEYAAKTMVEYLHKVQRLTDRKFAVNTPIGTEKTSVPVVKETFDAMIDAVCREREKDPDLRERLVLYITSGGSPKRHHKKIHDAGFKHFHLVGAVRQALSAEAAGVDAVIASGFEMGGHTHWPETSIHTFILVPAVVQAVKIPVIACGGMCDAATFAAALAFGTVGVQMGTRFIASKECDFHENYKKFVIDAGEYSDIVVPSFISAVRVLKTEGANDIIKLAEKAKKGEISQLKKQQITDDVMRLGEREGTGKGLIAAGQVSSRINSILTVREIIDSMVEGAAEIIHKLQSLVAK